MQNAKASGGSSVTQVGGNLYNYWAPGVGPAAEATASLPGGPGFLVGRSGMVSEILDLLSPGTPHQMVTAVAGLPGVGKTALTLYVAHRAQLAGWFTGGVLFADLHGYEPDDQSSADKVIGWWLRALGVRDPDIPPTPDQRKALYRSLLYRFADQGRRVLLIADNASSAEQVGPLIPARDEHRLLVTSRDMLPSLPARLVKLDELPAGPAVELIANVVHRARPQDNRVEAEVEASSELTILCGGLPLALELAAQMLIGDPGMRITTLNAEIASELNRLALPDGGNRGQLAPIRAAFDFSYRRLSPEAAGLFLLLPANPSREINTEAAAAVSGRSVRQTRAGLAELARASLIKEQPTGGDRWQMHDLIRSYAHGLAEKRISDRVRAEARGLLLEYYRDAARDAGRFVGDTPPVNPSRFRDRTHAIGWLDDEYTNLIEAVSLSAATGHDTTAVSLARSILPFLEWRFYNEGAIIVGETALDISRRIRDRTGEVSVLTALGIVLANVRRLDESLACQETALALVRELADRSRESSVLGHLGNVLWDMRRYDEALTAHRSAAAICRELDNRRGEANAVNEIGLCLRKIGRPDEALAEHHKALAIYREREDRHGERLVLNNIGVALKDVNHIDEAMLFYREALTIYRELGDRHGEAAPLTNLGNTLNSVRRFEEATAAHEQAVAIYRDLGDLFSEAAALGNLGNTRRGVRHYNEAIVAEQQAVAIFAGLGERHEQAKALTNLGRTLRQARRFSEAIFAQQQAVAIFAELGDRHDEAEALANLGAVLFAKGRFGTAIIAFRRSIRILRELGELPPKQLDAAKPFWPQIRSWRSN